MTLVCISTFSHVHPVSGDVCTATHRDATIGKNTGDGDGDGDGGAGAGKPTAGEEALRGAKGEEEGGQGERVALPEATSTQGQAGKYMYLLQHILIRGACMCDDATCNV